MKFILYPLTILLGLSAAQATTVYSETRREAIVENYHGYKVSDPYRWLEKIDSPEVRTWVNEQTTYSRSLIDSLSLKSQIETQLKSFAAGSFAPPIRHSNGRFYMPSKGSLYSGSTEITPDTLLVDVPALFGNPKASLADFSISPDGSKICILVNFYGADFPAEIIIYDIPSGKIIENSRAKGSTAYLAQHWIRGPFWMPDSKSYIYTKVTLGEYKLPIKSTIVLHDIDTGAEELLFEKQKMGDETQLWYARPTDDGRLAIVESQSSENEPSQVALLFLDKAKIGKLVWLKKERNQHLVYLGHNQKDFFFRTDAHANNLKIVALPIKKAIKGQFQTYDVVSAVEPMANAGFAAGKIWTVTMRPEKQQSNILRVYSDEGILLKELGENQSGSFDSFRYSPTSLDLYFHYSDYFQPRTLMRLNLSTLDTQIVHQPIPSFDKNEFSINTLTVPRNKNNPDVQITLLAPSNLKSSDKAPLLLHFYGNVAGALTPQYAPKFLAFLRMGGRVAIAHVRGGPDKGSAWVNAGRALNKKNTFIDVIRVTESLQSAGLTAPSLTVLDGRSSGGFNVSALANLRPDLFGIIAATVPMGDMVRYPYLAWGNRWHYEYGDPRNIKEFENLYRFSPYHNVKFKGQYPAIIFFTTQYDDRVNPAHGYKLAAAFQYGNRSSNPILLIEHADASHGSKVEALDELTFAFWRMGL